ncbi:hypothetical protein Tco_0797942 [Tanacetum coccineum]
MTEALAALEATYEIKKAHQEEKQSESYEEIVYRITEVDKETYSTPKKGYIGVRQFCKKKRMSANIGHLVIRTVTYAMEEREKFGDKKDDIEENSEDPEECREDKANIIIGVIHDKLNADWFKVTSEDKDDLEGILDYLKPRSYNGFIDLDNKAYNKRRCRLLGLTYEEPPLILIEKVMVTRYTIGPEKIYIKVKLLGIEEMPRTRDNVASIRARLMEKMANDGNGQEKM